MQYEFANSVIELSHLNVGTEQSIPDLLAEVSPETSDMIANVSLTANHLTLF